MSGLSVLVVEDNDGNLKLARTLLEMRGLTVLSARTGAEAVELARFRSPDVILLDIQLPDRDGESVLIDLRADDRTSAIPVIAVTALAMSGDRARFLAGGFDGYLSKPIDVATFVDSILAFTAGELQ